MPKIGELNYLQNLGEGGIRHAVNKPYSDRHCGDYLITLGWIRNMLPPPPARLLDLGCGTGWTSCHFAKMGYDVVGQDIAGDMIHWANHNKAREQLHNVKFAVSDYESMEYEQEFDCAVFFDSLHHAEDEYQALEMTYKALKTGGVCITREPGEGHSEQEHSRRAIETFNVTEKDMPPVKIVSMARQIGFEKAYVFPYVDQLLRSVVDPRYSEELQPRSRSAGLYRRFRGALRGTRRFLRYHIAKHRMGGLVCLVK